jgi:N-acetylglucosaminyldiphosphoundecaprenol N-acetyl-beta-D-mannosaminyltransferase
MSSDLFRRRLRIGQLWIDAITFPEALQRIEDMIASGRGGSVFTPNVDHVIKAETNGSFRDAYQHASLSVADGMPLVWASRLLGCELPERVAGSDLLMPLMRRAAAQGWRVYLLGGGPGAARKAAARLSHDFGVRVVGWDDCRVNSDGSDVAGDSVARVQNAAPDLVLVGLGPPKQELWIERASHRLGSSVAMGIGAGIDFIAGRYTRAPQWMARTGLEWTYRLLLEPRRLWRRYLWEGPRFASVFARTWLLPARERITEFPSSIVPSAAVEPVRQHRRIRAS